VSLHLFGTSSDSQLAAWSTRGAIIRGSTLVARERGSLQGGIDPVEETASRLAENPERDRAPRSIAPTAMDGDELALDCRGRVVLQEVAFRVESFDARGCPGVASAKDPVLAVALVEIRATTYVA
jgi:hypothetical protein